MMTIARICILSILVAACGPQEYSAPTGVTVLTEEELLNEMIGNTLSGVLADGVPVSAYYVPPNRNAKEGVVRGKGRNDFTGTWKIDRQLLCLDFRGSDDDGCWTVAVDGNKVVWYNPDGSRGEGPPSMTPGNPNNF